MNPFYFSSLTTFSMPNSELFDFSVINIFTAFQSRKITKLAEIDISFNPNITDKAGEVILKTVELQRSITKINLEGTGINEELQRKIQYCVNLFVS